MSSAGEFATPIASQVLYANVASAAGIDFDTLDLRQYFRR
jgi:hypothetical protein